MFCLVPIFIPIDPNQLPDLEPPDFKWWQWAILSVIFLATTAIFDLTISDLWGISFKIGFFAFFIGWLLIVILGIIFIEIN